MHYIGDFILQSHYMATFKSRDNLVLSQHATVYCFPFILVIPFIKDNLWSLLFIIGNSVMHFGVDYWTSRWTSYLWKKQEIHWFFVVIGLDQLIHMTTLVVSFNYLIKVI